MINKLYVLLEYFITALVRFTNRLINKGEKWCVRHKILMEGNIDEFDESKLYLVVCNSNLILNH